MYVDRLIDLPGRPHGIALYRARLATRLYPSFRHTAHFDFLHALAAASGLSFLFTMHGVRSFLYSRLAGSSSWPAIVQAQAQALAQTEVQAQAQTLAQTEVQAQLSRSLQQRELQDTTVCAAISPGATIPATSPVDLNNAYPDYLGSSPAISGDGSTVVSIGVKAAEGVDLGYSRQAGSSTGPNQPRYR